MSESKAACACSTNPGGVNQHLTAHTPTVCYILNGSGLVFVGPNPSKAAAVEGQRDRAVALLRVARRGGALDYNEVDALLREVGL